MQGWLNSIAKWVEGREGQEENEESRVHRIPSAAMSAREALPDEEDPSPHDTSPVFDTSRETMEVSALLLGRSPWVAKSDSDTHLVHEERERSISFASVPSDELRHEDRMHLLPYSSPRLHPRTARESSLGLLEQINSEDDLLEESMVGNIGEIDERELPKMSTMRESIFNTVNLLMGVGLLSYPYILKLSGWIGLYFIVLIACICNYTGRLIGMLMEYRPKTKLREGPGAYTVVGFHDLGMLAFGHAGALFVSVIFFAETFGYGCIYLIIEGDNLHKLLGSFTPFKAWDMHHFVLLSAVIFLPTLWLRNLSILSYFSALGAMSAVSLFLGVVYAGFDGSVPNQKYCKGDCTGSILRPSPTIFARLDNLTAVIGLGMVGFAGHAVFPTIRNDMIDKTKWPTVLNHSYVIICVIYVCIATCGYLMYGDSCQEEITLNLGYNLASQLAVWIVVVNPISKFALDMAPICLGVEGIAFRLLGISEAGGWRTWVTSILLRTSLAWCAVGVVSLVPSFGVMMGVLGSICSFTMAVTFPCACLLRLMWEELSVLKRIINIVLVVFGTFSAVMGTIAAIQNGNPAP